MSLKTRLIGFEKLNLVLILKNTKETTGSFLYLLIPFKILIRLNTSYYIFKRWLENSYIACICMKCVYLTQKKLFTF